MLRPGRLDKILYVGFPGPRDRLEILKAITKGGTRPRLGEEVNLDKIGTDSRLFEICSFFISARFSRFSCWHTIY